VGSIAPLNRRFRLTRTEDFERVRRQGKPYPHPLVVLIKLANELQRPRIGVAAGRSVGNAVKRNRAKRLLREGMRPLLTEIQPGHDIVLLGRTAINQASGAEVHQALAALVQKASLGKKV
jgi:ribonuclease P protein component